MTIHLPSVNQKTDVTPFTETAVSTECLSEEILLRIFRFLPDASLNKITKVNRQWHKIGKDEQNFRSQVALFNAKFGFAPPQKVNTFALTSLIEQQTTLLTGVSEFLTTQSLSLTTKLSYKKDEVKNISFEASIQAFLITYCRSHGAILNSSGEIRFILGKQPTSLQFLNLDILELKCFNNLILGLTLTPDDDIPPKDLYSRKPVAIHFTVWDLQTGNCISSTPLGEHVEYWRSSLITDSVSNKAFVILKNTIKIFHFPNSAQPITIICEKKIHPFGCHYIAQKDWLIALVDGELIVFSASTGEKLDTAPPPNNPSSLEFFDDRSIDFTICSKSGELYLFPRPSAISNDGIVIKWNEKQGQVNWLLIKQRRSIMAACFSHTQNCLFIAAERFINTNNQEMSLIPCLSLYWLDHAQQPSGFPILPDKTIQEKTSHTVTPTGISHILPLAGTDLVIVAYTNGEVKAWNTQTKKQICLFACDNNIIISLDIHLPTSKIIIVKDVEKNGEFVTYTIPYDKL